MPKRGKRCPPNLPKRKGGGLVGWGEHLSTYRACTHGPFPTSVTMQWWTSMDDAGPRARPYMYGRHMYRSATRTSLGGHMHVLARGNECRTNVRGRRAEVLAEYM